MSESVRDVRKYVQQTALPATSQLNVYSPVFTFMFYPSLFHPAAVFYGPVIYKLEK